MKDSVFIDTNILIYLVSDNYPKKEVSKNLLINEAVEIWLNTQIINEFINVTHKKKILQCQKIFEYSENFIELFNVGVINKSTIFLAIKIFQDYKYSYYDSLVIAAAIESNCTILYSEDLQNHQFIYNRLKIVNPFI